MAEPATQDAALDPRLTPVRPELAAKHLEGKVAAARFVEGEQCEVAEPQAGVRHAPAPDSPLDRGAQGRARDGLRDDGGRPGLGQLDADGYVGWLPANALRAPTSSDPQGRGAAHARFPDLR
jgi:hypothetical protein